MNKSLRKILLYILIALVLINIPVLAAEDTMPLDEIEAGMTGYGKTVFSGNKIEEFDVEIIDVLDNRSLDENLILIKLTGDKVEEFGGIAAGMSGSPIYINDRLIGAIGFGWNNSDHRYGLVTPIGRMLKLLEKTDQKEESNNMSDMEIDIDEFTPGENIIRSSSPIMVSGINGRALDRLEKTLSKLNLEVIPSSGIKKDDKSLKEPEPGEAVAVQLVRGDISVASIGTLTYIEQGKFLAFGHPFTNRGDVNYLLSRANISAVIPSSEQPFKLGSPYHRLLGSVTQDRGAGIAGELNSYPRITPLYISISENGELLKEVSLQIINDEYLFSSLSNSAALQAVDSALDRIGPGSAEAKVKIMGRGLPELQIESSNMYYSQSDIGSMALNDFSQILDLILTNPFKEINLIDIRLELDFQQEDSVALIQEAKVLNEEIHPGDQLEVEVTLHRYRNGTETKKLSMKIPEDAEPGIATLFIDGGYTGETVRPEDTAPMQSQGGLNEAEISGHKSFESILNAYLDSPDNNDLILQLYPSYAAPVYQESSETPPNAAEEEQDQLDESEQKNSDENRELNQDLPEVEEIKERFATEYVLEGTLNLDLEILSSEENKETAAAEEAAEESDKDRKTENVEEAGNDDQVENYKSSN